MFVFVTEQSISSGWIYFEAGYAYSKGVHVIPVGIGVSVGDLKAPLNLLQGFNIISADSLNNFLTIINREFNYSFPPYFTEADYNEVIALSSSAAEHGTLFDEIIRSAKFELPGVYFEKPGEKKTRETKAIFDGIKSYLDEKKLDYALGKPRGYGVGESLAVKGIKVDYIPESVSETDHGKISVSISPYNFDNSFQLYLQIADNCMDKCGNWLWLRLKDNYEYINSDEDCAALLLEVPDWFSLSKSQIGRFVCSRLNLDFRVVDTHAKRVEDLVLAIHFNPAEIKANDVVTLVSKLHELNMIHRSGGIENV